jgi:hypothetical protein
MTIDDIKQAIAKLSPDERAGLRAWLAQLDAGDAQQKAEPEETAASKFGRLAGRTFADFRNRMRDK